MNDLTTDRRGFDLDAIRERLADGSGPQYWRSLEELAQTPEFEEFLHREFPENASEWTDPVGRRGFLKLMAASLSLAGLSSCTRQPREVIVPYVTPPEQAVPGKPLFYATAMPLGGMGLPVLAESHMGRPTKIEGNPDHPASLGATDVLAQASILTLYDPDRSRAVLNAGAISTWSSFVNDLTVRLAAQDLSTPRGAGLRLLTGPVSSPTLAGLIRSLLERYPGARWHQYDPAGHDQARLGAQMALGEPVEALYHFDKADVILSLDGDFLCSGPGGLRYARDFAKRRRPYENDGRMNRLYVAESSPSNTGAAADHRLRLRPEAIASLARAIGAGLGLKLEGTDDPAHAKWVAAVVKDLQSHRGTSLVLAGDGQPPAVHALAHALNEALGNVGQTVHYIPSPLAAPVDGTASLKALADDMAASRVDMLVVLNCNPVYDAPADLNFAEVMGKVRIRVHLGLYDDETAELCHWHVPAAHYLEAWGDIRTYDGSAALIQPLIAPLHGGKSEIELVAAMLGRADASAYELVRAQWRTAASGEFEAAWQRWLHDGMIAGSAPAPRAVKVRAEAASEMARDLAAIGPPGGLGLIFRPDPSVRDGAWANNGWLQELPKPLTKLTWDNAVLISPATAQNLGLANEDQVELQYRGRSIKGPVWVFPGHADGCATVYLGYGRKRAGRVGTGAGFSAYALRTHDAAWSGGGLEIRKTGERYALACTQHHHSLEGRHIVRWADLPEYQAHPDFAQHKVHKPTRELTLYPQPSSPGYAWGMAVDLNSCVGCNACVVACQAENNVPVVGKDQVIASREMHWLRIDRYYSDDVDNPRTHMQPMMCVHCEYAPCEVVCPVAATVHSNEGLNDMVYNRCVGTRYCSNNCPYKVRRFNFLQYADRETPVLKLLNNPDVTVRTRGIMEKCTYCVQRINSARIESKREDREIRDGEVVTACQGACPTQAIVFGDINDPNSRVSKLKANQLSYGVLEEINTRPRTSYLAKVWNPNPELTEPRETGGHHATGTDTREHAPGSH